MKTSRIFLNSFVSLGLLLSLASSPALAAENRESISEKSTQLSLIERPLLRIGMTLGGFAIMGLFIASAIEVTEGEVSEGEAEVRNPSVALDQQPV